MAKVHDKFVIELAEVIKGYGNDPDVDDPFRLSEFYRFYELPEIAVSANHFKTMIPLEVVEKNAQPGWIPCSERCPEQSGWYLVSLKNGNVQKAWYRVAPINQGGSYWRSPIKRPLAWMPLPKPWEGGQYNGSD